MKLALALVLVGAALAALPATAGAAHVIRSDARLADYRVKADGTLLGARRAFRAPTRLVCTSDVTCSATWRALGLRIGFYDLGGPNPCGRRSGRFSNAVAGGDRWRTSRGLWIGDRGRNLRRLYPSAVFRGEQAGGRGWWLVKRRSSVGAGGTYPGLLAVMRDGRVRALVVRFPAGGD